MIVPPLRQEKQEVPTSCRYCMLRNLIKDYRSAAPALLGVCCRLLPNLMGRRMRTIKGAVVDKDNKGRSSEPL